MGGRLSGLCNALYDSKRRQFLGRDGAGWSKLGVFYFFFYIGLAGFFCAMLAVFMALTPRDRPRYILEDSRMRTRSHPLAPGLGFRPQPEVDKSLILVKKKQNPGQSGKNRSRSEKDPYVSSLDNYLKVYYWSQYKQDNRDQQDDNNNDHRERVPNLKKFIIQNPGECTINNDYGYTNGQPCVLVKMNKMVDFIPKPGFQNDEREAYKKACPSPKPNAISVHCYGEYPADVDNLGPIHYVSENGFDTNCGSLETSWFPYEGKINRQDYYQAPYIWVQLTRPKTNVLINVLCRAYGQNIDFDKKTGRALTRFQIYVEDLPGNSQSRRSGEF